MKPSFSSFTFAVARSFSAVAKSLVRRARSATTSIAPVKSNSTLTLPTSIAAVALPDIGSMRHTKRIAASYFASISKPVIPAPIFAEVFIP
ncbi:unannotated protein [freshwater metagenome]|uniref:Unannotated protein n=1 Tax=freshwater metagenome TaxID=449393 RepID=A0A6J6BXM6_9ZZZZ